MKAPGGRWSIGTLDREGTLLTRFRPLISITGMLAGHATERRTRAKTALVVLVLAGTLVLSEVAAACHHHSHPTRDESCTICLLASVPLCLPEAPLAALPAFDIQQRPVLPPTFQPISRPLFVITTRGPPPTLR